MFKKIVLTALAVAAGLFILNNTKLGSYGVTALGRVKKAATKQVPIEFEIERIKQQIAKLGPDMKRHLSGMAEEIVAIENLKDDITTTRANLNRQKEQVRVLADDLKSGTERVSYQGRTIRSSVLKDKLARDVAGCKRCEKDLELREKMLEEKEKGLESAREQLATMRDQKAELELQVAQIESEVRAIRTAQAKSKFQVDDSRLTHIKQSLRELQNRLQKDRVAAELEGQFLNDLPLAPGKKDTKSTADVIRDAEAYLNGDGEGEDAKVVAKPTK
jgi:chromosome segregation ATPase